MQNIYLDALSKTLPLTWGIICLRELIINKATITTLWQNGILIGLLINTALYLFIGVILFTWGQHEARELGVLAHY
jgi:hypothetical protein